MVKKYARSQDYLFEAKDNETLALYNSYVIKTGATVYLPDTENIPFNVNKGQAFIKIQNIGGGIVEADQKIAFVRLRNVNGDIQGIDFNSRQIFADGDFVNGSAINYGVRIELYRVSQHGWLALYFVDYLIINADIAGNKRTAGINKNSIEDINTLLGRKTSYLINVDLKPDTNYEPIIYYPITDNINTDSYWLINPSDLNTITNPDGLWLPYWDSFANNPVYGNSRIYIKVEGGQGADLKINEGLGFLIGENLNPDGTTSYLQPNGEIWSYKYNPIAGQWESRKESPDLPQLQVVKPLTEELTDIKQSIADIPIDDDTALQTLADSNKNRLDNLVIPTLPDEKWQTIGTTRLGRPEGGYLKFKKYLASNVGGNIDATQRLEKGDWILVSNNYYSENLGGYQEHRIVHTKYQGGFLFGQDSASTEYYQVFKMKPNSEMIFIWDGKRWLNYYTNDTTVQALLDELTQKVNDIEADIPVDVQEYDDSRIRGLINKIDADVTELSNSIPLIQSNQIIQDSKIDKNVADIKSLQQLIEAIPKDDEPIWELLRLLFKEGDKPRISTDSVDTGIPFLDKGGKYDLDKYKVSPYFPYTDSSNKGDCIYIKSKFYDSENTSDSYHYYPSPGRNTILDVKRVTLEVKSYYKVCFDDESESWIPEKISEGEYLIKNGILDLENYDDTELRQLISTFQADQLRQDRLIEQIRIKCNQVENNLNDLITRVTKNEGDIKSHTHKSNSEFLSEPDLYVDINNEIIIVGRYTNEEDFFFTEGLQWKINVENLEFPDRVYSPTVDEGSSITKFSVMNTGNLDLIINLNPENENTEGFGGYGKNENYDEGDSAIVKTGEYIEFTITDSEYHFDKFYWKGLKKEPPLTVNELDKRLKALENK